MPTVTILGDTYQTVIMPDGKEWLAENLKYNALGVWYGGGSTPDGFGKMYRRTELDTIKALLADGWQVPTKKDWGRLYSAVSGNTNTDLTPGRYTVVDAGGILKSTNSADWNSPNTGATDAFGFKFQGTGTSPTPGTYNQRKEYGYAWAADAGYHIAFFQRTSGVGTASDWGSLTTASLPIRLFRAVPFTGMRVKNIGLPTPAWRDAPEVHVVSDREVGTKREVAILGLNYQTVVMPDGLEWLSENLQWDGAGVDYDANPSNRTTLGRLYNHAQMSALVLPDGWRVARLADWQGLLSACGGASVAGGKLKSTGTTYWDTPNTGATDEFGFHARGGGYMYDSPENSPAYFQKGITGIFWLGDGVQSADPAVLAQAYFRNDSAAVLLTNTALGDRYLSIRLVRDNPRIWRRAMRIFAARTKGVGDAGTASILGRTYNTVVLPDGKEWMASGLDYTPLTEYGGYNAANVATIAAMLTDGWRFPTPGDATALQALVVDPTELAKIRTTVGWASTQGTNLWGLSLYPGGWLESTVLWHLTGTASLFWLANATQVVEVTNTTFHINDASAYVGNLTSRKFTIRLVRDNVPRWREVTK